MSTFYGGEQLDSVVVVQDSSTLGNPNSFYTVPSGKYAVVEVLLSGGSTGTGQGLYTQYAVSPSISRFIKDTVTGGSFSIEGGSEKTFYLNEGDTLNSNVAGCIYQYLIKEYKKP